MAEQKFVFMLRILPAGLTSQWRKSVSFERLSYGKLEKTPVEKETAAFPDFAGQAN
jgi:hypothetical protein